MLKKKNYDAVEMMGKLLVNMVTNLKSINDENWRNASAYAVISVIVSEFPDVLSDLREMFGGDSDD